MGSNLGESLHRLKFLSATLVTLVSGLPNLVMSQIPPQARDFWDLPPVCVARHDVGKLVLGVSNKGYFGNSTISKYYPCIKGVSHYTGSVYPKSS